MFNRALNMNSIATLSILAVVAGLCLKFLISSSSKQALYPPSTFQWAGRRNEVFSKLRAFMHQHTAISRTITNGYTKAIRRIAIFVWNTDLRSWQYSKQGLPFVLPTPAMRETIMLPQKHISWLVDQKDSALSVKEIRKKNLAIDWLLPTVMDPLHELFIFDVVGRDLPGNLGPLQPAILEEMRNGLEATMGLNDDGWREFCLW